MAKLINCIECGKSVSSEAAQCPHCKTNVPVGRKCRVCHQISAIFKESNGLCKSCANKLEKTSIACELCGSPPQSAYHGAECKNCGHRLGNIRNCRFCSLMLFEGDPQSATWEVIVQHKGTSGGPDWPEEYTYTQLEQRFAHKACCIANNFIPVDEPAATQHKSYLEEKKRSEEIAREESDRAHKERVKELVEMNRREGAGLCPYCGKSMSFLTKTIEQVRLSDKKRFVHKSCGRNTIFRW